MKRIAVIVMMLISCLSIVACGKTGKSSSVVGVHRDLFKPLQASTRIANIIDDESDDKKSDASSDNKDENTDTDKNNKVSDNSSNNTDANSDTEQSDSEEEQSDSDTEQKTEFEYAVEDPNAYTVSDENSKEYKDKLKVSKNIKNKAVVAVINYIVEDLEFKSVEIKENGEKHGGVNSSIVEYIVAFDTYDYYMISYYTGEGAVAYHDDTGTLYENYTPQSEKDKAAEEDRKLHEE